MIPGGKYSGPQLWDGGRSLYLPFSVDKALDSRITFTRASSGTYWGASGVLQTATTDEPRFDHNPVTGESLGLLVEGAATNHARYSEDLENATYYLSQNVTFGGVSSYGGLGFHEYSETTANTHHRHIAFAPVLSLSTGTFTSSIFVRKRGRRYVGLTFLYNASEGATVQFDLDTQSVTYANGQGGAQVISGASKIELVGENLYRLSAVFELSALMLAGGGFGVNSYTGVASSPISGYGADSFVGDPSKGFVVAGWQIETGTRASSYIPTAASQVTRAADSAAMTGTNFSEWFNAAEGTFVLDAVGYASGQSIVVAQNAAVTNYIELAWRTSGLTLPLANIVDGGVSQASLSGLSAGSNKIALAYRNNDFALSANGGAPTADSSGAVPSVDRLVFYANSTIKRLTYYPRRLTNGNLQELST